MPSNWGKKKYDYYSSDYKDKDFPSITRKDAKLAQVEEEEAAKHQDKILSIIDVENLYKYEDDDSEETCNIIDTLKELSVELVKKHLVEKDEGIKDQHDEEDDNYSYDEEDEEGSVESEVKEKAVKKRKLKDIKEEDEQVVTEDSTKKVDESRPRRPINTAIRKNRGLTVHKSKEKRNPRVKHKMKYKRAVSKRRRIIGSQPNKQKRYTGEPSGINPYSIKSIKF